MNLLHKRIYIQWCQSPRVEVTVGDSSTTSEVFRIPREFLRRRSRFFHEQLEGSDPSGTGDFKTRRIHLANTSVQTAEDFFVWNLSPQPQIDVHATFEDIARLGVLSWTYRIPALSNQVTDLIRQNLAEGVWCLQASLVDDVYAATTSPGCPLRDLIREALGQLPRSTVESGDQDRESWKATFLKHAQLGWDYIDAGGKDWTREKFLEGRCRFHDHKDMPERTEELKLSDECPYLVEESFPTDEEQKRRDMLEQITGKEWKAAVDSGIDDTDGGGMLTVGNFVTNGTLQSPGNVEPEENKRMAREAAPTVVSDNHTATTVPSTTMQARGLNGEHEKINATTVRKAPSAQMNGGSIFEPVDNEVNGQITFKSMIDKASNPRAVVGQFQESNLPDLASTAVVNGSALADSESIPDEADGTVTSESAREEFQKNGDITHTGGGVDKAAEEGGLGMKGLGKKNKKKKGSISRS